MLATEVEKDTFFYTSKFLAKAILPEKSINCKKSEFTTKQRKMCFEKVWAKYDYQTSLIFSSVLIYKFKVFIFIFHLNINAHV